MAVKIRLTRKGDKKSPFYRIVAADSRCARNGNFIEVLGTYNPMVSPAQINLKNDRIAYWLSVGAQLSDTTKELFEKEGLVEKKAYRAPKPKQMPPKKKEAPAEAPAEEVEATAEMPTEAPVEEQPAAEEASE